MLQASLIVFWDLKKIQLFLTMSIASSEKYNNNTNLCASHTHRTWAHNVYLSHTH